jgi:hypothetical protein
MWLLNKIEKTFKKFQNEFVEESKGDRVICANCMFRVFQSECDHASNKVELFDPIYGYSTYREKNCRRLNFDGNCKNYKYIDHD